MLESALNHCNLLNFILFCNWYLHNPSVDLWVLWLLSVSYSLGHSLLKYYYSHALEYLAVYWASSWLMILFCFIVGVSLLCLRLLLYYLNPLATTTLIDWPARMVCSLLFVGMGYCSDPHGSCSNLHLVMTEKFPLRTMIHMSLRRLFAEHSGDRFESFFKWAPPSLLLSLILVIMHAQNHDSKCLCCCWNLVPSQNEWDEVKGLRPIVYENCCYETKTYNIMKVVLLPVFNSMDYCWQPPSLQDDWNEEQRIWPCIRAIPSYKSLKAGMQLQASHKVFEMQDPMLGSHTLIFWAWFDLY